MSVVALTGLSQLNANSRDQLVERERLAEIVGRTETETTQLRLEIGPSRHDDDRELRTRAVELTQDGQAVDTGKKQIEENEVIGFSACALQALRAVSCRVDNEAFGFESSGEEPEDARLVLDHQDPHCQHCDPKRDDRKMTSA